MSKKIIKEIGIVILLLIAVVLLLAIVLYEFIPNNKTVPIKIQPYEMPEDIQKELKEAVPEEESIVRTYYIDSTDLNLYEATNDYDKGKANPFADYTTEKPNSSNSNGNGSNNTETNNTTNSDDMENGQNEQQDNNEVYINTPGKNY